MSLKMPIGWLAIFAFFLVGILPSAGSFVAQLIALASLFIFGALVALGKPRRTDIEEQVLLYWVIGVAAPLLSVVNSGIYESPFHVAYSVLFGFTMALAKVISARERFSTMASLYVNACALLALALIVMDLRSVLMALSATQTEMGLSRLTLFGGHPNLAGHVFGLASAVVLARFMGKGEDPPGLAALAKLILFLALLLATSSRGAMLALCISLIVIVAITLPKKEIEAKGVRKRSMAMLGAGLAGLILAAWKIEYLVEMLDINSSTRGIGSGGTGRLQNWQTFLASLEETPAILFFGHGYRSWPIEKMGFDNDSSYIALIYEFGLPITILFVILLIKVLVRSIRVFDADSMSPEAIAVLVFAIFESLFARYLTSAGNPASLIVLISFLSVQHPVKASGENPVER